MAEWNGTLRPATQDDVERVGEFYVHHKHDHVLGRDPDVLRRACEEGRQFVIEVDGEGLIAVSGYFPVADEPLIEVGGTRVVWEGFGLQDVLFWARFASIALTDADALITTAVDPSNTPSTNAAVRHGFVKWDDPAPVLLADCDAGAGCEKKKKGLAPGAACCSQFYRLPPEALKKDIGDFLAATRESLIIRRPKKNSSDVLLLTVACRTVTQPSRREDLEAFIRGEP